MDLVSKEYALSEFRIVCDNIRRAERDNAPAADCIALSKLCGELIILLHDEFHIPRGELLRISSNIPE